MYDIFISYKHTAEGGILTEDYVVAKKLYEDLTNRKYNVFFSDNSLKEIGSSKFKADIDKALDEAKMMIVILSKPEYAMSKWVNYEWDSFYNDYLSGVRENPGLFTLTSGFNLHDLPRTLRNVQSFKYNETYNDLIEYIINALPKRTLIDDRFEVITGKEITIHDLEEAVALDHIVYPNMEHTTAIECKKWHDINPDIYILIKDVTINQIIAYTNITPVTEECYNKIKSGEFVTTNITDDMILSYDMPFPYSVYFFSIAINPLFQNTKVFSIMLNVIIEKFIDLAKQDVYIKRMIADAVTLNGNKFCNLFGMRKIKNSTHESMLYETTLIPPSFRVISKKLKELYDLYKIKYEEASYLFDEE